MKVNRIVKLGLEETAHQLKTQGLSDSEIARELSKLAGEEISRYTVLRYFKSNKDPIIQKAKQREEIVSRAINNRLDVVEQLNRINQTVWQLANKALESGDSKTALQSLSEIRRQIELQAKLLGDLPDQQIKVDVEFKNQILKFEQNLINFVLEELCYDCRRRLERRIDEIGEKLN
ncbi:hypothetical protein DRP05_12790 [Archaeoglobales archaeon]|nr:MAG: hypothetical protein DRO97_09705 [Archaeoglobales archaeon]RLI76533.1 MAG: hypothetical protein DRP05_12790 [Archaeoglobales archaeon]